MSLFEFLFGQDVNDDGIPEDILVMAEELGWDTTDPVIWGQQYPFAAHQLAQNFGPDWANLLISAEEAYAQ